MDLEIEAPVDDLEALVDEEDMILGDAAPTPDCTQVETVCS
jgi:hypothetical protein